MTTDGRVIEAENLLQGQRSTARRCPAQPATGGYFRNPLRPSWGEPYTEIVARMRLAIRTPPTPPTATRRSIVSHQLPIWMARCDAEGRRLVHDPRRRECTLASVTSFTFIDGRVTSVGYREPAGALLPAAPDRRSSSRAPSAAPSRPVAHHPGRLLRAVVVGVALVVLAGCTTTGADEGTRSAGQEGYVGVRGNLTQIAPADRVELPVVSGTSLDGKPLSTADFRGQVLVINVWGSWCAPCRAEAPALKGASEATKGRAQFLGITTRDNDPAQAQAFVRAFDIGYPSIYDPDGKALLQFSGTLPPSAIPSTLIVDAQGRLAARVLGEISQLTLVTMIDQVAAE